jgi:hypothetical protein
VSGLGVDLDRLAEYAAGLLDAHEATEVELLVAARPDWAQALAALEAAQPRVHAALAGLGAAPVPDDVVHRLDAALAHAARPTPSNVIDLASRRRRRWTRIGAIAAAASVVAAGCVGGTALLINNGTRTDNNASSGAAPAGPRVFDSGDSRSEYRAVPGGAAQPTSALVVLATGSDYTAASVTGVATLPRQPAAQATDQTDQTDRAVPAELDRLTTPAARDACLTAITNRFGGAPSLLDYAYYRNEPAVVVVLTGGRSRIVVVGPRCGLPDAGSDTVASVAS